MLRFQFLLFGSVLGWHFRWVCLLGERDVFHCVDKVAQKKNKVCSPFCYSVRGCLRCLDLWRNGQENGKINSAGDAGHLMCDRAIVQTARFLFLVAHRGCLM